LAEWLSNRLSVRLGPGTFGLPYRFGRIEYQHHHETGKLRGSVAAPAKNWKLAYEADTSDSAFQVCPNESLDEFLLERYTAFTACSGKRRLFRIWHEPWPQAAAAVAIHNDSLLANTCNWFTTAKPIGANYSTGARNVWMGRPHRINAV
jgi:uncharacterized protein